MKKLALVAGIVILGYVDFSHANAQDDLKRIAFSKKMGVEVLGKTVDGTNWCQETSLIVLKANEADFFKTPKLAKLIGQLSAVLPKDCPNLKKLDVSGYALGNDALIYKASADSAQKWALVETEIPVEIVKADNKKVAPPPPVKNKSNEVAQNKEQTISSKQAQPEDVISESSPVKVPEKKLADQTLREVYDSISPLKDFGTGGSFNLVGDWSASYSCEQWGRQVPYSYTLSIYKHDGEKFQAYALFDQYGGEDGGSFEGSGNYLTAHNQLSFETTERLKRGSINGFNLVAKYDENTKSFKSLQQKNECTDQKLNKTSDIPFKAIALKRSFDFANKIYEWNDVRLVRGSGFGKVKGGDSVTFPGCNAMSKWHASYPLDQRLAINNPNESKVLLHFQDEITNKLFGMPAYYWGDKIFSFLAEQVWKNCRKALPKETYNAVRGLVKDRESKAALKTRNTIDHWIANGPVAWINSGYDAATLVEQYQMLAADTEALKKSYSNNEYAFRYSVENDLKLAQQEMQEFAKLYGVLSIEYFGQQSLDLVNSEVPYEKAKNLLAKVTDAKGEGAEIDVAKASASKLIIDNLQIASENQIEKLNSEWANGFNDFTEIDAAKSKIESIRSIALKLIPEAHFASFETNLSNAVRKSADKILEQELVKLKEGTGSPIDQVSHMSKVESAFNEAKLTKQNKQYKTAADGVRETLVAEAETYFSEQFANVTVDEIKRQPVSDWVLAIDTIENMPDQMQKDFGSYPVKKRFQKKAAELRNGLDEKFETAIKQKIFDAFPTDSIVPAQDMKVLSEGVQQAIYPMESPHMKKLVEIQKDYSESLLDDVISQQEKLAEKFGEDLEEEVKYAMQTSQGSKKIYKAWDIARSQVNGLGELTKSNDDFEDLLEVWEENEEMLSKEVCKTEEELGSSEKKTLVVAGSGTTDLGSLVCAMKLNGLELFDFSKPGLMGDDFYTMKFTSPKGNATLKLKEAEIAKGIDALIGFSISDGVESQRLNRDQWAQTASQWLLGAQMATGADFGADDLVDDMTRKASQMLKGLFR